LLPVCAEEKERERIGTGLCCRWEKRKGRQKKYTARGEDKGTVEEVERIEEQHS
jgi:hypothetical protein